MDAHAPDFSAYWSAPPVELSSAFAAREEHPTAEDEQAMAELVERVSAARSVV